MGRGQGSAGPTGSVYSGPHPGLSSPAPQCNAGRRDLGKGVRKAREVKAKGFYTCCSFTWLLLSLLAQRNITQPPLAKSLPIG